VIGAEHRTAPGDLLQGLAIASGVENLRQTLDADRLG
jgi:hypothetical protein